MRKTDLGTKDLLNPQETIEHFRLSGRKFYAMLKANKKNDFVVLYGTRKLIIRVAFQKYLLSHPELRRKDTWE
ncbi:hypothetical protein SAMN02745687_01269 [Lachnospiraceae bacterium NK3A20]|nr:hypothetical protein SAMN02745687_01269 [Lachnospiraceae bacterium NK3A20]